MSVSAAPQPPGRIKPFAYVTAEKAVLYRAIMRAFMESKERFVLHLRSQEILNEVGSRGIGELPGESEIESALSQLCEWGNLEAHPDTTDVTTVEDFYKQRFLFRITAQGEAAERALDLFESTSDCKGELQTGALSDIRKLLQDLYQIARDAEPDSGRIHRNLLTLRARFDDLNARAQLFMGGLHRRVDLKNSHSEQFILDRQRRIGYIERFIGELVIATDDIALTISDLEAAGIEKLLQAAAHRIVADAVEEPSEGLDRARFQWHSFWERLRNWFVSRPGRPSNAEILRGRARAAIPALLRAITTVNDQKIGRIDRSNDLRVLARWFVEVHSEADAHRLWRAVFGLCPARHLIINDATLDQHESLGVPPDTSWLDAPPLRISLRLRTYGSYARTGRLSRIIDRTAEKEKLAAATHEEALRILKAQGRFATGSRMRLSELEQLDSDEFDLFLELLGEAVSARVLSAEAADVLSSDGSLRVKLEPTGDGRTAVIHIPEGVFSGPDHWISIERNTTDEVAT